jgi:hypothetical protein
MSDFLRQRHEAITTTLTRQSVLAYTDALRLPSVANGSRGRSMGALRMQAERKKNQRLVGAAAGRMFRGIVLCEQAKFFVVRLTRISPRSLDSDNLESALKSVRDGVANVLGIDDRDPRVRYVVDQRKGEHGESAVRIELYLEPRSVDAATHAAGELRNLHTDDCLLELLDPGGQCICRPPAVPEPHMRYSMVSVLDGLTAPAITVKLDRPVRVGAAVATPNVKRAR